MHAGIISFRTPNSSFIFDLLRRSIKECAVFLAIFLPATLVEEGCFFFGAGVALTFPDAGLLASNVTISSASCPLGFICMIFRDLVGGGGSAKTSLDSGCAIEDLRRILTTSEARIAGDLGEVGW